MRLSESVLVSGLRHPDVFVREAMLRYFEECHRVQADITGHVIAAVDAYGWQDFALWPHRIGSFECDAECLEWVVGQFERTDDGKPSENTCKHLRKMIANSPVEVLVDHLDFLAELDWLRSSESKNFDGPYRSPFELLQLRVETWQRTPAECWELLEQHAHHMARAEIFAAADVEYANILGHRIATEGDRAAAKVLARLPAVDREMSPEEEWIGGVMIDVAGHLPLEAAVEPILDCLELDWDWYNEEVARAISRIGTPKAAEAVRDRYASAPWEQRIYLTAMLESIHCDGMVDWIKQLIPTETDEELRTQLAVALATQYDDEAVEPALAIYEQDPEDPESLVILECLYAHARLRGDDSPRADEWRQRLQQDWDRFSARRAELDLSAVDWLQALDDFPEDDAADEFEEDEFAEGPWDEETWEIAPRPAGDHLPFVQPIRRDEPRVGRNAPCPCGSGKKYKKCCLSAKAK